MTNDAYPGGANAVSESQTSERISDLGRAVSDGFGRMERDNQRIERRLDNVVTQSEFNATVLRLDGQDKVIEEKVDKGLASVSQKIDEGFKAAESQTKERNSKNRWFWGIAITGLALVNGIVFNVIGVLLRP